MKTCFGQTDNKKLIECITSFQINKYIVTCYKDLLKRYGEKKILIGNFQTQIKLL